MHKLRSVGKIWHAVSAIVGRWCYGLLLVLLAAQPVAAAESRYVRQVAGNRQVIVFVHGVTGNSDATWTNADTGANFPTLLAQDPAFAGSDVFVVEYPSPSTRRTLGIDEVAESMRLVLDAHRVLDHAEVVFVAHSMGGLVTRAYLLKYRDVVVKRVRLLYFFATPTTGSAVAALVRVFSGNPQFGGMVPMASDGYLADVYRAWLAAPELAALPSFCAYEVQNTFGVKVVDQVSATALCNRRPDPIDRNHASIVKPSGRGDVPYLALKTAMESVGGGAGPSSKALRLQVQAVMQIRPALQQPPQIDGTPLYCGALRLTLVLAHAQRGGAPIRVHSVGVRSEPVPAGTLPPDACAVDVLGARAHGIVNTDVFRLSSENAGVKARFMKDATHIVDVPSENLLRAPTASRAVTLKPGEAPEAFEMLIDVRARTPQRLWFVAEYDDDGPRTLATPPILIWK